MALCHAVLCQLQLTKQHKQLSGALACTSLPRATRLWSTPVSECVLQDRKRSR